MARVRRKVCFCTSCGKQNPKRKKSCKYCTKKLHQKNHLLRDYMIENIKDKFKDEVTDRLYSIIKNYLLSHIYGTFLVATVIISATSIVLNTITNKVEITKVETRPVFVASNLAICKNSLAPSLYCEDSLGFNENNMCVKVKTINAEASKVCSEGYHLSANKCISDKTYTKTTEMVCQKPNVLPDFLTTWDNYEGVYEYNGECILSYCIAGNYDENGECTAGSGEAIPYTEVTSCTEGSMINGECHKTKSNTTKYTCEEGTLDGKKCNIEYEEEPVKKCDEGYVYNEDCNACVEVE